MRARSAARLLGGSAGSAGCQLTGPVAETPDVDLRRSAASHHQTELGGRCPGGAEANSAVSFTGSFRKKSYSKKHNLGTSTGGVVSESKQPLALILALTVVARSAAITSDRRYVRRCDTRGCAYEGHPDLDLELRGHRPDDEGADHSCSA